MPIKKRGYFPSSTRAQRWFCPAARISQGCRERHKKHRSPSATGAGVMPRPPSGCAVWVRAHGNHQKGPRNSGKLDLPAEA